MFYYDNGLFLTRNRLGIDVRRRQARAFVSHAHADHMAPHELAICTPVTARFYEHRLGKRPTLELPFEQPIDLDGLTLTTFPAGHVFGSAMLLVEDGWQSLLYTGDFRLGESATAEPARMPRADVLVMESTYGDPRYQLPPRDKVVDQFLERVRGAFRDGMTPVIQAYVLGKAQEVTRLLTSAGIGVLQHPLVFEISRIYENCGRSLGEFALYPGQPLPDHAVIVPPRGQRASRLENLHRCVTIAVTGWAADRNTRHRLGVDYAIPLSDHADYGQLLTAIDQVQPKVIYATHGPRSFVDRLRDKGLRAYPLDRHAREEAGALPRR
jgi:Cft2 family RNA processing exonuclease